jgi:hypothetical protein
MGDPDDIMNQPGAMAAKQTRYDIPAAIFLVALWSAVHLAHSGILIVHDSWSHIFPLVYNVTKQAACGALPGWLGMVDNGSPHVLYVISFSLTQIIRVPLLYLMSCTHLDVVQAMYLYKVQIYVTYLVFALSTYLLGRMLFQHRIAAVYLLGATLFAGLCLDSAHSNQVVNMLFWVPWMLMAAVLYHRHADSVAGAWYLNAFALFFCLQALDQYPHFIILATAVAAMLYFFLEPRSLRTIVVRHGLRLWPAFLIALITAGQLLVVKQAIADYMPSLRSDLVVDPRTFGETGFVQPTALIGTFFPLSFMTGFDVLADAMGGLLARLLGRPTGRMFIFRLDSLVFYVGMIPAALTFVFVCYPGLKKIRIGWVVFTAILFLVSLQQSKIYLLLFHVPFFNVFRSYFLYIMFVAFAVLVMSGYGLDVLLSSPAKQKRAMFRRAVGWLLFAAALSAAGLGMLIAYASSPLALLRSMAFPLVVDLALIAAAILSLYHFCYARDPQKAAIVLLLVLGVSQGIYFSGSYRVLGTTVAQAYNDFGLDDTDRMRQAESFSDANVFRRKLCTKFAQCYLSQHDTVSLNTDLQGTFLRHRDEPVFQRELVRPVQEALAGLTHPVFWLSRGAVIYHDRSELLAALNARQSNIQELLGEAVYIRSSDIDTVGKVQRSPGTHAKISHLSRGPDNIALSYESDGPVYLNAAVNYDPGWRIEINGQEGVLVKGNVGGITALLPAGGGNVRLHYENRASDFFFFSRFGFLIVSLLAMAWIWKSAANSDLSPARRF